MTEFRVGQYVRLRPDFAEFHKSINGYLVHNYPDVLDEFDPDVVYLIIDVDEEEYRPYDKEEHNNSYPFTVVTAEGRERPFNSDLRYYHWDELVFAGDTYEEALGLFGACDEIIEAPDDLIDLIL